MDLWFIRENIRAFDRAAIEEYGIPGIALMEHAGIALRDQALKMLNGSDGPVLIVCGSGNNGGDGYALARLLHNEGIDVSIVASKPTGELKGDAALNARVAEHMNLSIIIADDSTELTDAALVVDALLGTGLTSAPRGIAESLIEKINAHPAPVLAADLPSGLDCDTGEPPGACVRAGRTLTFTGMKAGFADEGSREWTGGVSVGAIGAPRGLLERYGVSRKELSARQ